MSHSRNASDLGVSFAGVTWQWEGKCNINKYPIKKTGGGGRDRKWHSRECYRNGANEGGLPFSDRSHGHSGEWDTSGSKN